MAEDSRQNLDDLLDLSGSGETPEALSEEIERTVRDFERRLNRQLNQILHHPHFRALEKVWRELRLLVESIPADANVEVDILSVAQEALLDDSLEAQSLTRTGLFRLLYDQTLLRAGESPYSALVLASELGRRPEEIEFLSRMAALGSVVHTPVLIGLTASFFGVPSYAALQKVPDLPSRLQGSEYTKWHSLRDEEEARFLVACACGFALRYPYGAEQETEGLETFVEEAWRGGAPAVLWGNPAFAMASVLARAFRKSGSIATFHGTEAGRVDGMPVPPSAPKQKAGLLEVALPREKGYDFALNGILLLSLPDPSGPPCFLSAQTAMRPRTYQSRELTVQLLAYSRLTWVLFSSRIAQSLLVLFREGRGAELAAFQRSVDAWLEAHLASEGVQDRPFQKARGEVSVPEDGKGWWLVHLEVVPSAGWEGIEEDLHVDVWIPANY